MLLRAFNCILFVLLANPAFARFFSASPQDWDPICFSIALLCLATASIGFAIFVWLTARTAR